MLYKWQRETKSCSRQERKLWIPVTVLVAIVSRKVFFDPSALGGVVSQITFYFVILSPKGEESKTQLKIPPEVGSA